MNKWKIGAYLMFASVILVGYQAIRGNLNVDVLYVGVTVFMCVYAYQFHTRWKYELNSGKEPYWMQLSRVWHIMLVLTVVRLFIVEPMVVPTGSLLPTVQLGDRILVQKFAYSSKIPLTNIVVKKWAEPRKDELAVFYPPSSEVYYIKRVVAVGGDTLTYDFLKKQLTVNGKTYHQRQLGSSEFFDGAAKYTARVLEEQSAYLRHRVLAIDSRALMPSELPSTFSYCQYTTTTMTCNIPKDHYFMMGDNRDSSQDSRYFGAISFDRMVGRAEQVLFNPNDASRRLKSLY